MRMNRKSSHIMKFPVSTLKLAKRPKTQQKGVNNSINPCSKSFAWLMAVTVPNENMAAWEVFSPHDPPLRIILILNNAKVAI